MAVVLLSKFKTQMYILYFTYTVIAKIKSSVHINIIRCLIVIREILSFSKALSDERVCLQNFDYHLIISEQKNMEKNMFIIFKDYEKCKLVSYRYR